MNEKINFTDRQVEILKTWSSESSIEKTADTLGVSRHTIETQLKRMRKKVGVNRTVDVYIYARDKELIK